MFGFGKPAVQVDSFQGQQLLTETEHEMTITMSGDSLENTVGNVFQVMRKQIFEEIRQLGPVEIPPDFPSIVEIIRQGREERDARLGC